MSTTTLTIFTAGDAKARFGELLDTALGRPVGITKHDRLAAYLVSKNEYESLLEKLQELEDRLWLIESENARKAGFADAEKVDALLGKLGNVGHDSGRAWMPSNIGKSAPRLLVLLETPGRMTASY